MCLIKLSVLFIILLLANTYFVNSDISDDECGISKDENNEMTTLATLSSSDKPPDLLIKKKKDYFKKKIPKKSLLLVFDGTGSMSDDLSQMRDAAKEIVTDLSSRKDKPIQNYVLTVFKDPCKLKVEKFFSENQHVFNYDFFSFFAAKAISPTIDTEDPNILFSALDSISLGDPGLT
jgi:hypothetical protein